MEHEYIGEALRNMRLFRGMSQDELGFRAGISQKQISRIENDLNVPRWSTFVKLGRALDLPPEVFFL